MTKLAELVPKCSERISQNSLHMAYVQGQPTQMVCFLQVLHTLVRLMFGFFGDVKGDVFRCWTTFYQVSWWNGVNWAHMFNPSQFTNSLCTLYNASIRISIISQMFGWFSFLSIPRSLRSFLSPCWQVHCWRITFTISGWAGPLCNTWTSLGSLFYGSGWSHKSWSLVSLLRWRWDSPKLSWNLWIWIDSHLKIVPDFEPHP